MSTRPSTVQFVLDQLSTLKGVRARKMFGEYALYYDEKVVGLVCDDQLFIKLTLPGRAFAAERYVEGTPYPGAKPSMLVDADLLEDDEQLCALVKVTAKALRKPAVKASKKKPAKKANARRAR